MEGVTYKIVMDKKRSTSSKHDRISSQLRELLETEKKKTGELLEVIETEKKKTGELHNDWKKYTGELKEIHQQKVTEMITKINTLTNTVQHYRAKDGNSRDMELKLISKDSEIEALKGLLVAQNKERKVNVSKPLNVTKASTTKLIGEFQKIIAAINQKKRNRGGSGGSRKRKRTDRYCPQVQGLEQERAKLEQELLKRNVLIKKTRNKAMGTLDNEGELLDKLAKLDKKIGNI